MFIILAVVLAAVGVDGIMVLFMLGVALVSELMPETAHDHDEEVERV